MILVRDIFLFSFLVSFTFCEIKTFGICQSQPSSFYSWAEFLPISPPSLSPISPTKTVKQLNQMVCLLLSEMAVQFRYSLTNLIPKTLGINSEPDLPDQSYQLIILFAWRWSLFIYLSQTHTEQDSRVLKLLELVTDEWPLDFLTVILRMRLLKCPKEDTIGLVCGRICYQCFNSTLFHIQLARFVIS